jgi:hypothetical protein
MVGSVVGFVVVGGRIAEIDVIADPAKLRQRAYVSAPRALTNREVTSLRSTGGAGVAAKVERGDGTRTRATFAPLSAAPRCCVRAWR